MEVGEQGSYNGSKIISSRNLGAESETLRLAIEANRNYIAGETLAAEWSATSLKGEAHRAKVKVEKINGLSPGAAPVAEREQPAPAARGSTSTPSSAAKKARST